MRGKRRGSAAKVGGCFARPNYEDAELNLGTDGVIPLSYR